MQVATEKKNKIVSLAINLIAALKSAIESNDEQPFPALSSLSASDDLDAAVVFLASSDQYRPIVSRYFAQSINNRQINYLKNQFIQQLNLIIKKQQRDPSETPGMALRNYADRLSQACKTQGSLSHEARQSLAEDFKHNYHLTVEVDDFEGPIIYKAISESLKRLGCFEEAFYFGYFAYINAKGNQKVSDPIDLLEIAVELEKNSFDKYKHFLFIEILKLAPKGDIKSGSRLLAFIAKDKRFTPHEKHILLYATLLMPISLEDKIITLMNGLYAKAVYIDQVLLLQDLINLPHKYSPTIRKMVISILSDISPYKMMFYMLDETLATRSGQVSFSLIHNKITTSEFIGRLSTIDEFTKRYKQIYLVNDPVFDNIFAACVCKNYDTIDHILNFVLININPRTLAWVRFLAEFCSPIFDHIKAVWLKNLQIAFLLLCSCNIAILKEIDDNFLIKIISTYREIIIVEFAHNLKDRLHFLKEFLERLQQLPKGTQGCREFVTQSPRDKVETLLETVIAGYEDNLAVYLLQLGARPNTTGLHGTKLIAHALQHGCTNFVNHLVAIDPSLSYLKTEVVEVVRKYPLCITKIEPFSQKEAFIYLLKETQEISNSPQKKLGQIMRVDHFVKKLSNSTERENKELYTLYNLSFTCYPLLYQLIMKANLATHCTSYFSKESAALDCQLLVLKSFNFLSLLEKKEPDEENLATQLERIVKRSPGSIPMLINFFTYWLPITTTNKQFELILNFYFIFRSLVLSANFNAPGLMLLMLKLPISQYTSNLEKSWSADKQLAWICFQLIASALSDSQSQFKNKFLLLAAPSDILNLAIKLSKQETFLDKLAEFLITLRKEDETLITQTFSELKKIFKVLSAKKFENALTSDDIEEYRQLINEFDHIFENEKFSHVITLIQLHLNKKSEILTFLLKQDQKTKTILNANQRKIVLETIIENDSAHHLQLAIDNGLIDTRSLPQSTSQHTLYALALQKGKQACADLLLPNFISGDFVLLTAKHGSDALFQRAINANSSFEVKDDNLVTYEEIERACLGNKDKLTIIAMTRLQNQARFKDQFPEKLKRYREKVKTNNPSGEELFRQFKHQVDILKSYSVTLTKQQNLTKNDYTACNISLRELMHQFKTCGKTNIQRNLNDAEYGQMIALLTDIDKNINLENENQELSQDLIISYLQWIESIQDKPAPTVVTTQNDAVTKVTRKKPPHNKSTKNKVESQSSTTPLVVVPVEKSLYFYQPVKPKDALNEDKSSQTTFRPRMTDTISAINKEIEDTLKNIIQIAAAIQNVEGVAFNEETCNKLLNEFRVLNSLLVELDDNLDVESNYYEYKLQLELLKFDQDLDQELKMQVTLLAEQFLNPKSKNPSSIAPIDIAQKSSKTPCFFKPAIMLDDINKRCDIRQAEVKLQLEQQNIDFDNLFYRVFRFINTLSSIYRPALRLRHFLIHRFYLVETEHLLQLARAILKLNFAERKSFLPIEQSVLYKQAETFLNPFLKKGKQETCDFTTVLKTILTKLKKAREHRQEDKMLWLVTQVGELAKQTTIQEVLTIRTDTDYDCRALRNRIAHDDYQETNKPDEQVAFHGLVNQLIEADPANLVGSMSLRA